MWQDQTSLLVRRRRLFSTISVLLTGIPLLARVTGSDAVAEHWRLSDGVLRLYHRADEVHLILLRGYMEPLLALRLLGRIKNVT